MRGWEKAITRLLAWAHLEGIKRKILAFAIVATMLPSLAMGWLSYRNNVLALEAKLSQELDGLTTHTQRDLEEWLNQVLQNARVFASSYEISENVETLTRTELDDDQASRAAERMTDYLRSVGARSVDFQELLVLDREGRVLASSSAGGTGFELPVNWLQQALTGESVLTEPYVDERLGTPVLVVAQPIQLGPSEPMAVLAGEIDLRRIARVLVEAAPDDQREIFLVDAGGAALTSSRSIREKFRSLKLSAGDRRALEDQEGAIVRIAGLRGLDVIASMRRIEMQGWTLVAETDAAAAYSPVDRLRNVTLGLAALLLLGVGSAAYLIGLTIVRPLDRLTQGAARVGRGDLEVDIPVFARNEVGYLTEAFNKMVARLRETRVALNETNQQLRAKNRELREASITDGLTGLFNRTYLNEILPREFSRCRRHREQFAVLMIDIDHFKEFNDTHGHQAGDDILGEISRVFRDSVRRSDYAARYGGEEFLVLLTHTGADRAAEVAEKIRERVETGFADAEDPVTVSIGVASYPDDAHDVETLVREADRALYHAKRTGRNRVCRAEAQPVGPRAVES